MSSRSTPILGRPSFLNNMYTTIIIINVNNNNNNNNINNTIIL